MTPGERARKARENVALLLDAELSHPINSVVTMESPVEFTEPDEDEERGPGAWVTVRIWTPT